MSQIVPAYIPTSLEDVFRIAKVVKPFTRELHIDVVDGVGVDAVSWPYGSGEGSGTPEEARTLADMFDIEYDLMVADGLSELPRYLSARPKRVVVHVESCVDIPAAKTLAKEAGVLLGIASENDTPLEVLFPELVHADYVQCMGIATIGSQGQPFDERIFGRIAAIRHSYPDLEISADGSVNIDTIARLELAGVSRFIVGSAVIKQKDPGAAYRALYEMLTRAS
jgi:pentose-5-phosphate-3-epimerase